MRLLYENKAELGSEYSSAEETHPKGRGKRTKFPARRESASTDSDKESDVTLTPPPTLTTTDNFIVKSNRIEKAIQEQVQSEIESTSTPPLQVALTLKSKETEQKQVATETELEPTLESNSLLFVNNCYNTTSNSGSNSVNITDIPVMVVKDNISMTDLYVSIVELTKLCTTTQEYVKSIEKKMKSKETQEGKDNFSAYFKILETKIPFKNIDSLVEFDKDLSENMETKKIFTNYVKKIGGDDVKDSVHRILKYIFSNELATKCSWYGRNDNFPICQLYILKVITDIVVMQHDGTLSSIQRCVSEWFRLANQRLQREMKKKNH